MQRASQGIKNSGGSKLVQEPEGGDVSHSYYTVSSQ